MIHVGDDWWLDCDQYCFTLFQKVTVKKGKTAGQDVEVNHLYLTDHERVIARIGDIAFKKGINKDVKGMIAFLEDFKKKFAELKETKRA